MSNKEKVIKINNEEDKTVKKKCKKKKSSEKDNEINGDVPQPSKTKSIQTEERNKNKEKRNKKICVSNDKEFDNACKDESEDDVTKNLNFHVDHKNITKNKNKKRKHEDVVSDVVSHKVKKIKTKKNKSEVEDKLKNETVNDSVVVPEKKIKNKLNFLNADEAEVKDEDIDRFCDGITEEDNETYENWVKLFEVNFKKNKKPVS